MRISDWSSDVCSSDLLSLFGPLAMSIRDAPTIRDLIHNLAELFPLHTQGAIVGMADDAGEILLTFELSADVHSSNRQVVERGFGLVVGEIGDRKRVG